ncbi:MAG: universal stress protein [Candidatus Korobacteraceae bacterium]
MATAQMLATGIAVRNVLIATDLSKHSDEVLRAGMDLRSAYGAHATVLYVLPQEDYALAGFEAFAVARDAARRDLTELEENLSKQYRCVRGKDYEVLMAEGDVSECVFDCARQRNIDLIVLGTHGRTGFSKAFVGSVAERIFRRAEVPVLTIGPCARRSSLSAPRRLLAPIDFTAATQHSAKFACALARQHQSELVLLHVIEDVPKGAMADVERLRHTVEQSLAELTSCEEKPKHVRFMARLGKIVPTVVEAAAELEADLLILGVHTYPKLLDHFRWQNAYELVRQAPCPVLTVR